MNNKIIFLVIGLVIGGLAVFGYISAKPSVYPGAMIGRNTISSNSEVMDAHFIEQMIPHHEDAVTMSKLAENKATRPEVKKLAVNIISSQTKEIEQMKVWYKDWFGKEIPAGDRAMNEHGMMGNNSGMNMGMSGDESDMARLTDAEDFDKVFIEQMIPHHQSAIMMANMLKTGTTRPEMKELAENIIASQTSEIDQMRQWLKSW
mgnify:CR=1 FL=1